MVAHTGQIEVVNIWILAFTLLLIPVRRPRRHWIRTDSTLFALKQTAFIIKLKWNPVIFHFGQFSFLQLPHLIAAAPISPIFGIAKPWRGLYIPPIHIIMSFLACPEPFASNRAGLATSTLIEVDYKS